MYHVTNGLLQLALLLGTTGSFPTWARLEYQLFPIQFHLVASTENSEWLSD